MSEVAILFNPSQSLSDQVGADQIFVTQIIFGFVTKLTKQGWNGLKMQPEAAFFGSRWIGGNFWPAVRLELSGPRAFAPVADTSWQPRSPLGILLNCEKILLTWPPTVWNTFDREKRPLCWCMVIAVIIVTLIRAKPDSQTNKQGLI